MKIKSSPVSKRTPIYDVQVSYMAKKIFALVERFNREFSNSKGPTFEDCVRFGDASEYIDFIEATFICGFVCGDYPAVYRLDDIHARPEIIVPSLTFNKLRHYIHTLQRSEKWADHTLGGVLVEAIRSGALALVADRLNSDSSLYEIN